MSYANDPMDQVIEGMDVYGSDGKKLGEVGDVTIGVGASQGATASTIEERSIFQVKRGFMGLGQDLYIPGDAVDSVASDRVTLRYPSDSDQLQAFTAEPSAPATGTDDRSPHAVDDLENPLRPERI